MTGLRQGFWALAMGLTLMATAASAQQGIPVPNRELVVQGTPSWVLPLDHTGSVSIEMGAGYWMVTTRCRGARPCQPAVITGIFVGGQRVGYLYPAQAFGLLFNHSRENTVRIEVAPIEIRDGQTRLRGRTVTVIPALEISDQAAAGNLTSFLVRQVPSLRASR